LILHLKEVFRAKDEEKILSEPLKEASLFFPEARRLTSYYYNRVSPEQRRTFLGLRFATRKTPRTGQGVKSIAGAKENVPSLA